MSLLVQLGDVTLWLDVDTFTSAEALITLESLPGTGGISVTLRVVRATGKITNVAVTQ